MTENEVRQLPISAIVRLIPDAGRNPIHRLDAGTFGEVRDGVCYGCYATDAVQKLSGVVLTVETIEFYPARVGWDINFTRAVKSAINLLRHGALVDYNLDAFRIDIATIPNEFLPHEPPALGSNPTAEQLAVWDAFADELEKWEGR